MGAEEDYPATEKFGAGQCSSWGYWADNPINNEIKKVGTVNTTWEDGIASGRGSDPTDNERVRGIYYSHYIVNYDPKILETLIRYSLIGDVSCGLKTSDYNGRSYSHDYNVTTCSVVVDSYLY